MSRVQITTCDAPGCTAENRTWELSASWHRVELSVRHGPFATMVDHGNDVPVAGIVFACCEEHVRAAVSAAVEAGFAKKRGAT